MKIIDLFESGPIKLRGFKVPENTPATAFMIDYEEISQEHPFTRGLRYFEDGPVLVEVRPSRDFSDTVEIGDIQSKAKGAGAKVMSILCSLADKHGVAIELFAMGYADVPTLKLVEYYARFGFEPTSEHAVDNARKYPGEGVEMRRSAK